MIDMELGRETLADHIKATRSGQLPNGLSAPEVWDIMCQITAGVADIHKHGIIHRDLKPANSTTP